MLNASLFNLVGAKTRQSGKWSLLALSVVLLATFALAQSAPSAQAQTTSNQPVITVNPDGDGAASLTWTVEDDTGITGWRYEFKPTSADWSTAHGVDISDPATLSADVSGLTVEASYDFRVRAVVSGISGDWSVVRQVFGKPGIPENFMATASTTEVAIVLTWDYPTQDGGNTLTAYKIEWREDVAGNWTDNPSTGSIIALGADTSLALTTANNLQEGTTYNFRIHASNADRRSSFTPGDGSVAATLEQAATTATISATDPDPLTERTLHGSELTVDLAGTDYASSPSPNQFSLMPPTTGLSVASVDRESETRAILTLAFTGNFNSDLNLSVEVASAATAHSAALTTDPVTVTAAPRPVQVTGVTLAPGSGSLEVSWNAVDNADGYRIQYFVTGQVATIQALQVSGGSTTSATIPNLLGATKYSVWVLATNEFSADGLESTTETATTLPVTDPGVTLLSLDPIPVPEGGSSTYSIRLNLDPQGNVVIRVRATGDRDVTVDTDATADGNQDTLTFTPENWNTTQTVTVAAARDDDAADDTATITHSIVAAQSSNEYDGVTIASVAVLVTDGDTPGVTVSEVDLTIDEGSTATYTVALATQPTGNVRISVSSDHDSITVSPAAFTLTRSNWERGQTVTVRSRDDDRAMPVSATITHAIDADATTADEYDGASLPSVAVRVTDDEAPVDYDMDEDGGIEIANREQLNAVRYDLDGNGVADNEADAAAYRRAFPRIMENMCAGGRLTDTSVEGNPGPCVGYELSNGIALSGSWTPIGGDVPGNSDNPYDHGANVFTATFDGQGHTISGLRVSRASSYMVGLFGAVGGNGTEVRNVCVSDVNVRGKELVGALVGYNNGGLVERSCSTGQVTGNAVVGGLVGWNRGTVERSYSEANVTGFNLSDSQGPLWSTQLGGLVGGNYGTVVNTYATGAVRGSGHVAGLAGSVWNNGVVRNSYATGAVSSDQGFPQVGGLVGWIYGHGSVAGSYYDTETSGQDQGASQVDPAGVIISYRGSHTTASPGQTTSGLQGPTAATGIYCGWSSEDVNCDGGLDPVSEDVDHDGNLDVDEDVDGDGYLDVDEDTLLRNGRLDSGEDKDFDGRLDVDEDVDGDGRLDVDEDLDGDGRLDRLAEDINNNDRLTRYLSIWAFGGIDQYPCLLRVTPGCRDASVIVNAPNPLVINEGGSNTYTVVLGGQPTGNVVISMSSDNADVTTQPPTLTFTPGNWQTVQTVTVSAAQDIDAVDDTAVISHAASGADNYAGLALTPVNVAVTDTVAGAPRVTVTAADPLTVNEGASNTYSVVLGVGPTANVVITMSSDNADVTTQPAILTFTTDNWQTVQTVTVSAAQDTDDADDAAIISHAVSGAAEYNGIAVDPVNVAVTDTVSGEIRVRVIAADPLTVNEGGSNTYSVVLGWEPTANVVITISSDNGDVTTQRSLLVFTPDNWQTAKIVTVRAAQDFDDADDAAIISHAVSGAAEYNGIAVDPVNVAVTDTVAAGVSVLVSDPLVMVEGGFNTYRVALDMQPTANVVISMNSDNADVTADPASLTFTTGNWFTAQTVTVRAAQDVDAVDDTAVISHGVSGAAEYAGIAVDSVNIAVTDDDSTSPARRASVKVTAADPVAVNEGASATYTMVLDGEPTANVVVKLSSDNADVTTEPASLTFTTNNWDTAQTVTVRAAHDGDAADDKATVSHAVSGADEYAGIVVDSVNFSVTDDDTAGVTVSETSLSINEGGTATYTVVLDTQPIADVEIYPFAHSGVTAEPDILTFTPDNWDKPQTVTVSAAQDENTKNEEVTIVHGISAAAESAYADADVTIASVTVSVTDDDTDAQPVQPEPENNAPVAEAGPDQSVDAGAAVSLDGSVSSDPDRDDLTYVWTQTSGPSVTLSGASSAAPRFTAPNEDATLVFSLTVNDGTVDSAADTVAITVVVPDPQREALEAFYNATGGSSWTNSANWLTDQPLGEWHGVTVNGQGQVTHLALRNNNLSGPLPAALGDLEALQVLSLDRNSISGSLPTQLGNLSNLTRLAMNRNQLTGSIPTELGNLSNLSIIGLARNQLSGTLPSSLGNLTGLTRLSLHDNTQLSGPLPDGFVNMDGMQRLAIARTGLCAPNTDAFTAWLDAVPDKPDGVQTCGE